MDRRLSAVLLVLISAVGCGGSHDETSVMPDVIGKRLDVARSDLSATGIDEDDIEVVGGGTFGVVDESNWTVCDQDPSAGAAAKDVRVVVDRVCGTEDSGEGARGPSSTVEAPQPTSGGRVANLITVPDAVGMDLQDAQDTMQAAGLYNLVSHDATGRGRFQVVDHNWRVCNQSPPGGSSVSSDSEIDFGAVKDEELCP